MSSSYARERPARQSMADDPGVQNFGTMLLFVTCLLASSARLWLGDPVTSAVWFVSALLAMLVHRVDWLRRTVEKHNRCDPRPEAPPKETP